MSLREGAIHGRANTLEGEGMKVSSTAPFTPKKLQCKYISDHLCFSFFPSQAKFFPFFFFFFYHPITRVLNGTALTFWFLCRSKKFLFSASQDLAMAKEGSPSSLYPLLFLGVWIFQVNLFTSLCVSGASHTRWICQDPITAFVLYPSVLGSFLECRLCKHWPFMMNFLLCVYFIFLECLFCFFHLQGLCYLVSYRIICILPVVVLFKNSVDNSTFILVFLCVKLYPSAFLFKSSASSKARITL